MSTTRTAIQRHGVLITADAAYAVLWYFGHPAGIEPGSFTASLLETFSRADLGNRASLLSAFPELGSAFIAAQREHDGIEMLRQVVAS